MTDMLNKPDGENRLIAVGAIDFSMPLTVVQLASGETVTIPTSSLAVERTIPPGEDPAQERVLPVIQEELVVSKAWVPHETVRVTKTNEQRVEQREVVLLRENWAVRRVSMEVQVPERFSVRSEGESIIFPVFEERLVLKKVLYLVEELHASRSVEELTETVEASLLTETVTVERRPLKDR